ncbi:MAG TPA: VanZ family protein [Casimicrobiaceae bacterium]|nr:VanZ family protein [Casimicrobiaceae bacterium]
MSQSLAVATPSQPGSRLPQYLALLYSLMIVYASLEPFSGWLKPLPGTAYFLFATERARFTLFDVALNVAAYAPFGFFLALTGARRSAIARFAVGTGIGALLSLSMESLQMFLPTRDASVVDLASNTAGAGLGVLGALAFDRVPGLRMRIRRWRYRVFMSDRSGDLGLALLGIWLLAQANPAIPMFAATYDPSLELTRDFPGTLLQAAQSAFNVLGVGLFLGLLLRRRNDFGIAVLILIVWALMLKGIAATVLLKSAVWESWLQPGVSLGVAAGAMALLAAAWLPRPARTAVCAIALLSSLIAPLLAPDLWQVRAPLALFDWPYGQLLNFNGLTHAVLIVWPLFASVYLLWLAGKPGWGSHAGHGDAGT